MIINLILMICHFYEFYEICVSLTDLRWLKQLETLHSTRTLLHYKYTHVERCHNMRAPRT